MVASFAGSADYTSANSSAITFTIFNNSRTPPTVAVSDAGGVYNGSSFPATAIVNGGGSLEGVSPTLTYYAGSAATGSPLPGVPSTVGTFTVIASFPAA